MHPALTIQPEPPDTPDALALITALEATLAPLYAPENRHGLSVDALKHPTVTFLVARWNGAPAACGGVKLFPEAQPYAEVKRMYVSPDYRRRGIAQVLLQHIEQHTRQNGYTTLRLETGIHQTDAITLYEHVGFTHRDAFGNYKNDGISVFFEKTLTSPPPEPTR